MKFRFNIKPMQPERNLKDSHTCQALNIVRRADKRPNTPHPEQVGIPLFLEGNCSGVLSFFANHLNIPPYQRGPGGYRGI